MEYISILMSTFNESKEQISEAIESILNQDFGNYEFIIVNDNPTREELNKILDEYSAIDDRIRIINNDENIGLAMSLNKAAMYANTDIYARMDADDISHPKRLGIQYGALISGKYDLVFTDYTYIDEESKPILRETRYWDEDEIYIYLPTRSVIHHPTVMMTKEIFDKVGGYRNFPCSQDYDLWLRLLGNGCRFFMIDKKLFQYRIRENSISMSKSYEQKLTIDFIRKLYSQRLKKGTDDYSFENYLKFMEKNKGSNLSKQVNYFGNILIEANEHRINKKYFRWLFLRSKVFISSSVYRKSFLRSIKFRLNIIKTRYKKRI